MKKIFTAATVLTLACWVCSCGGSSTTEHGVRRVGRFEDTSMSGVAGGRQMESKFYPARDFCTLRIEGCISVRFVQDERFEVEAVGRTADLEHLTATVEAGELVLKQRSHTRLSFQARDIRVTVKAPRLNRVSLSGASGFSAVNLTADDIHVNASGASSLSLHGVHCRAFTCQVSGACNIDAAMESNKTTLRSSGAVSGTICLKGNDLKVNSTGACDLSLAFQGKRAEVTNSGAGDIHMRVDCDYLYAHNSGAANFKVAGTADDAKIECTGMAKIDTKELNRF